MSKSGFQKFFGKIRREADTVAVEMSDEEREQLREEVTRLSNIKLGGYSPAALAEVMTRSVLMLDESVAKLDKSSSRLAKVNLVLTGVVLLVAILQAFMAGCSGKACAC